MNNLILWINNIIDNFIKNKYYILNNLIGVNMNVLIKIKYYYIK